MGFFDLFGRKAEEPAPPQKRSARELARLARLAGDKMAQNYDRQEAIQELGRLGTADSAAALLRRFSFTMEPSITDQEEKESAVEGIVAAGGAALEPIREYCAKAESLTWPLKVLRRIVAPDRLVDELLGLLDQFDTEYVRNAEPKVQLLAALEEHPSAEVREAVEPFLLDVSEPVRFSAVGTVFAMADEASVAPLVAALEEEESLRIKNRIAGGLAEKGWNIPPDLEQRSSGALPPGFEVARSRIVRVG